MTNKRHLSVTKELKTLETIQQDVAEQFGIPVEAIRDADRLRKADPRTFNRVRAGEIPLPGWEPHDNHPIAAMIPPRTESEYRLLVRSIRRLGLLEPIVLYEGKILEGRHRYKACLEAGIKPQFITPAIDNPYQYVVSHSNRTMDEYRDAVRKTLNSFRSGPTMLQPISEAPTKLGWEEWDFTIYLGDNFKKELTEDQRAEMEMCWIYELYREKVSYLTRNFPLKFEEFNYTKEWTELVCVAANDVVGEAIFSCPDFPIQPWLRLPPEERKALANIYQKTQSLFPERCQDHLDAIGQAAYQHDEKWNAGEAALTNFAPVVKTVKNTHVALIELDLSELQGDLIKKFKKLIESLQGPKARNPKRSGRGGSTKDMLRRLSAWRLKRNYGTCAEAHRAAREAGRIAPYEGSKDKSSTGAIMNWDTWDNAFGEFEKALRAELNKI